MTNLKIAIVAAALATTASLGLEAASSEVRYNAGPFAGERTGVTFETPDTASFCGEGDAPNVVTATGVGKRLLRGRIVVEYETDKGRVEVPTSSKAVDQSGDLKLTLTYPSVASWPATADGTRKIHISPQLELWDKGAKVATLGPGHDWGVYCIPTP